MNAKKINIPNPAAQVLGAAPGTSERPGPAAKPIRLTADMPSGMHRLISRMKEGNRRTTKSAVFEAFATSPLTAGFVATMTREAQAEHPDISDPREALAAKYPDVAEFLAEFGGTE